MGGDVQQGVNSLFGPERGPLHRAGMRRGGDHLVKEDTTRSHLRLCLLQRAALNGLMSPHEGVTPRGKSHQHVGVGTGKPTRINNAFLGIPGAGVLLVQQGLCRSAEPFQSHFRCGHS